MIAWFIHWLGLGPLLEPVEEAELGAADTSGYDRA